MSRFAGLFLAIVVAVASATVARAADPVFVSIDAPGICGHGEVLGKIAQRFRHQVTNVPNLPQVEIVDFRGIKESRHLASRHDRPIDRRYCQASVALSNGHSRDVWYLIEKPMGFAGIGSNVEFCVAGFDRWNVYGGRCRALR